MVCHAQAQRVSHVLKRSVTSINNTTTTATHYSVCGKKTCLLCAWHCEGEGEEIIQLELTLKSTMRYGSKTVKCSTSSGLQTVVTLFDAGANFEL